jgi:hypothetical protein
MRLPGTRVRGTRIDGIVTAVMLACLAFGSACARQGSSQHTGPNLSASEEASPFQQVQNVASGEHTLAIPQDSKSSTRLPFHAEQPCILPSGTFLAVKLDRSLVPERVHAGDTFLASVAGSILIDGRTVIDSGTQVTGRIESAQASSPRIGRSTNLESNRGKGHVQLTLTAIVVDGKRLPLQTASLFARGTSPQSNPSFKRTESDVQSDIVRIQKGRRLTFRLIAPFAVDEPHAVATLDAPKE